MNTVVTWARAKLRGRTAVIGVPYLWLLVFFLLPFVIVLKISISEMENVTFKEVLTFRDALPGFYTTT